MPANQNIVGEVGLRVVPVDPAAQFQAGVDQIIKRLEKNAQFQIKASGLEDVEKQANLASAAFANAAIQAAGLTAAIYGIKASVEGAINKLSGLFDQLAQARAGFTSILHSEAAGGALLDDIREFARVSPFVTQELVNYSQQLLGVGLNAKQIIPLLKSTGDIISSVGGDTQNLGRVLFTLTQIKSIGVLKGQDTMQLQNSLIPITKYLSDYLHKSSQEIVKLREDGKITADVVFAALNQQGDKVKGAMDRATRNIAGAKAILSDTITQLFQNQPVLDKIFQDVFKSIANLANKMGEAEFQQAFAQFFDGVEKVYDGLKPLLSALAGLANSGVISGLQVFGTTLGIVGNALNAIPKVALEAFARLLLALGALKAPLLLIRYVTSIKTMASAILPATTNLAKLGTAAEVCTQHINAETAAIERNVAATRTMASAGGLFAGAAGGGAAAAKGGVGGFLKRNAGSAVLAGSVAATIGGGYLSQSKNDTVGAIGGGLQGAGIGAQIGMLAGPEGAAVGAVIGGALGAVTSFMARSEAKAKAHIEALKKLGDEAAAEYLKAEGKQFGDGVSGAKFTARQDALRNLQRQISLDKAALDEKTGPLAYTGRGGQAQADKISGQARKDLQDQLAINIKKSSDLQEDNAATFDPLKSGLDEIVAGLQKGEAGFNALTTAARGGVRVTATDLGAVDTALKKYGFTLADLDIPEKREQIINFIKSFDGLTTSQQKATEAAIKYNSALDAAKATAALIFDPQEKQIQSQIEALGIKAEAEKAQYDFSGKTATLNAKLAALKEKEAFHAERLAYYTGLGYDAATALYRANVEGETEYQRILALRTGAQNNKGANSKFAQANLDDTANRNIGNRDINKEIADNEARAKKAREDAEAAAKKALEEAAAFAEKVKSATASLADRLEGAAENIAAAAERWVGSIKERTQYEQAVSAGTAIRNTQRQIKDLTEVTAGLAELRARGLSEQAIKSLGIDNVSDVKQVRKLLKANPNDLGKLSGSVAELNAKATDVATAAEDKRTQTNIAEGIKAAADSLGVDFTKADAAQLASTFNITTTSNADEIAASILGILSGGRLGV